MIAIDGTQCPELVRPPAKISGAWVFLVTRVPVKAPFENLEDGAPIDQLLDCFPGVARSQTEAVLEFASAKLGARGFRMTVLFDQSAPVPIRKFLTPYKVNTAAEFSRRLAKNLYPIETTGENLIDLDHKPSFSDP